MTSGSSFTTLGFAPPRDVPTDVAAVGEAIVGLGLVALLISFLPSIYAAFQRRELMVSMLRGPGREPADRRCKLIVRHHRIGLLDEGTRRATCSAHWEEWFADIEETHTSQGSLAVLPLAAAASPLGHRVRARCSTPPRCTSSRSTPPRCPTPRCACARGTCACATSPTSSGRARPQPSADRPDQHRPRGVRRGLPRAGRRGRARSRPTATRRGSTSAGWRVNYDTVLVTLAGFFMAPYAPWSSDRSIPHRLTARDITGGTGPAHRLRSFLRYLHPAPPVRPEEE